MRREVSSTMILWVLLTHFVFVNANSESTRLPSNLPQSSVFIPMSSNTGRLSNSPPTIISTTSTLIDQSSTTPITPFVPPTLAPPTSITATASSSPGTSTASGTTATQSTSSVTSQSSAAETGSQVNGSSTSEVKDSQTTVASYTETQLPFASTPIANTQNNGRMLLLLLLLLVPVIVVIFIVLIVTYRHRRAKMNQQTKMKIREYELKYSTMGNEAGRDPGATNSIYCASEPPVTMTDVETGTVKSDSDRPDSVFHY